MAQNLPTAFYDSAVVNARQIETPDADFIDGMNLAASMAPGIGINTGDYEPKDSDWFATPVPRNADSGYIGIDSGANTAVTASANANANFENAVFIRSVAPVAPLGVIGQISGNDVLNYTGKTIPADVNTWGLVEPGPIVLVPTILKATGTYLNDAAIMQLTGSGYAPGLTLQCGGTRDTLGAWDTGPFVTTAETLDEALEDFAAFIRGNNEMTADAAGNHINLRAENGGISVTVSTFTAV